MSRPRASRLRVDLEQLRRDVRGALAALFCAGLLPLIAAQDDGAGQCQGHRRCSD